MSPHVLQTDDIISQVRDIEPSNSTSRVDLFEKNKIRIYIGTASRGRIIDAYLPLNSSVIGPKPVT